ncbi:MAG: hypothetical protein HY343_00905 [Lentisphaerae bacterium]|nr:hypothetical protein [Lentisphaerota bacterium]
MRTAMGGVRIIVLVASALLGARVLADDVKVWPLFYRNTDPESREVRTEVLWPLYVRQATPDYAANQFLSFPQRYPAQYPRQFYLFWPLTGLRAGHGHDAWLFPFLWSGEDRAGTNRHLALVPAFYYGRHGDARTLNLGILQHNRWDKHGHAHYLWPLFWGAVDRSEASSGSSYGALPLIWLSRHENKQGGIERQSRSGGVLLLNWWNRYQYKNVYSDYTTVQASDGLFPFFYRFDSVHIWNRQVEKGRSTSDRLWILPYWQSHESESATQGNVSVRSSEEAHHVLFPLYWNWMGGKSGTSHAGHLVFPFWWHSEERRNNEVTGSASFLVPVGAHLYKKGEYETQNLLGPFFNRTVSQARGGAVRYDAFFPFLSLTRGAQRSGGRVFPLAGWGRQGGAYDNLWYLFPLGWRCETQEGAVYNARRPQFWALHELESKPVMSRPDSECGPRRTVAVYPFLWSKRKADVQSSGVLPFYWQRTDCGGPTLSRETWLPLLLGHHESSKRNGRRTYARQDYLLSVLAHGTGDDYALRRLFPLFSYHRWSGHREFASYILPFARDTWRDPQEPETRYSSKLSIPFRFLPLFRTASNGNGTNDFHRKSWFFPFYKTSVDRSPGAVSRKLSILWPVWNGEWQNGETRIRGLGGAVNFYECDANGFVEQRLLYRVFTRRTRSWRSEHELMPFYAQSSREDGTSSWSFLGGLLGGGRDTTRRYLRLFYFKIPVAPVRPGDETKRAKIRTRHADLALNYLRHGRHDRAAIEFTLAGDARGDDREFQIAAGDAYLDADADAIGKELRSSVPSSLSPLAGTSGYCDAAAVRMNLRCLAIQRFETAIRLGADRPDLLRKIACALHDRDELAAALEKLSESDRLRPCFATGMERLGAANSLFDERLGDKKSDAGEKQAAYARVKSILGELQKRYPDSPSLTRLEAELPGEGESLDATTFGPMGLHDVHGNNAFSPAPLRRLALYERGATFEPGAEERDWLSDRKALAGRFVRSLVSGRPGGPATFCAQRAVNILNYQLLELLNYKKHTESETLIPRILELLPSACTSCADPEHGKAADRYDFNNPVREIMQQLYRLYVDAQDKPLAYIAFAKELAGRLCLHQREAVEKELERVRFEQQYLKEWRIAGVLADSPVNRVYSGKFFDRYVNLDGILGQPDRCTLTADCVVTAPEERPAVLWLGFDHVLTVELNGKTVFGPKSRKIAVRDEFRVPILLQPGENRLRLTVTDDTLAYGFFARLSSVAGDLMEDVAAAPAP